LNFRCFQQRADRFGKSDQLPGLVQIEHALSEISMCHESIGSYR
jgi:hypothetical protein